jgi:hypothetical protein
MSASEKQSRAFALSLIAGILIIANAAAVAAAATWSPGLFPTLPGSSGNDPSVLHDVALIGLLCGVLVVLGAMMLRNRPAHKRAWGIMIIVTSIPSVVTGGGFIIGFILGIIGGVKALSREPRSDN